MKALEAYNDSYITYPIDTIVARTDTNISLDVIGLGDTFSQKS